MPKFFIIMSKSSESQNLKKSGRYYKYRVHYLYLQTLSTPNTVQLCFHNSAYELQLLKQYIKQWLWKRYVEQYIVKQVYVYFQSLQQILCFCRSSPHNRDYLLSNFNFIGTTLMKPKKNSFFIYEACFILRILGSVITNYKTLFETLSYLLLLKCR